MKQLVRISLTQDEMRLACTGGTERQLDGGVQPKSPEVKYWDQHFWQSHIIGAISEYAVSKLLGIQWQWERNPNGFDVGTYQVRATENPANRLLVRSNDNPEHNFIFVKVRENRVLIEGWTNGQRVIDNNDEIFTGTYVMPNYLLYPITDLPEFPQLLPQGCEMFKPGVPRMGTVR